MSNVTPIAGAADTRRRLLCLKAQMVLGYISEKDYWRAIERANGGKVIPFAKAARDKSTPAGTAGGEP
jgi:hypothetical protein